MYNKYFLNVLGQQTKSLKEELVGRRAYLRCLVKNDGQNYIDATGKNVRVTCGGKNSAWIPELIPSLISMEDKPDLIPFYSKSGRILRHSGLFNNIIIFININIF